MTLLSKIQKPLLFILVCVLLVPACSLASPFDRYDQQIQDSMQRWMPGTDWQLLWGLIRQESTFNPNAVSPVGATGLTQFMPATWKEVAEQLQMQQANPRMAGPAIEAGAFYMARLRNGWHSPRPETDRLQLALASYNAGMGNLIRAQKACGMPVEYPAIAQCLPQITGHHARETLHYVPAVWGYYQAKLFGIRM